MATFYYNFIEEEIKIYELTPKNDLQNESVRFSEISQLLPTSTVTDSLGSRNQIYQVSEIFDPGVQYQISSNLRLFCVESSPTNNTNHILEVCSACRCSSDLRLPNEIVWIDGILACLWGWALCIEMYTVALIDLQCGLVWVRTCIWIPGLAHLHHILLIMQPRNSHQCSQQNYWQRTSQGRSDLLLLQDLTLHYGSTSFCVTDQEETWYREKYTNCSMRLYLGYNSTLDQGASLASFCRTATFKRLTTIQSFGKLQCWFSELPI